MTVRVVVVHVAPWVEAAAVVAVLAVTVVVPVVVIIDGPPRFGRDARAFCCYGPESGIADPAAPDAATEFPCCLLPCDVICCCNCCCCCLCFFVRKERVRSGTQLDGTVVAVFAWCCVLLLLLLFLWLHLFLVVDGCCGGGGGAVVCCCGCCCWFLLLVVGCADVLMCCDADALRCGAGCL